MPSSQSYAPPRRGVLWALAALCAAVCLGFLAVLVYSLRTPRAVNEADYPDPVPTAMRWDIAAACSDGFLTVEGWVCVEDDRFESVDIRPALLSADGAGWTLPTWLREDENARLAAGDAVFGEYGGFTGRCHTKRLPAGTYELCIAYRCNGLSAMIHTGQSVEVAP